METKNQLKQLFQEKYGYIPHYEFFAPGRVNLIGEHIDYNGGLVMPCAISMGTWLCIGKNDDNVIKLSSVNFDDAVEVPLQRSFEKTGPEWFNYPLGVINELQQSVDWQCKGLDLLFYGNIPIGSGLSSSASIEVVTAFALNQIYNLGIDKLSLVKLCKKVENHFIGVNSGIMDQFAVAFGEKDSAIILNCDTLKHKIIACDLGDYSLAIINTNKKRTLADSKYNQLVAECQEALTYLQQEINLNHLCELTAEKFALHQHLIKDETALKRATHVVKENDRVVSAAKMLAQGDLTNFGKLMYASHQSLKELYEVSGKELDTIVEFCIGYEHVIGARMTGAGFGGCAIALLQKGWEEDFAKYLSEYYFNEMGYYATIYVEEIGDGPKVINTH
jgi:galactokinase